MMTFVVLRDVHSQHVYVYLQDESLSCFCLPQNCKNRMAAVYQLKIKYDQDKFGVFFRR